MWTQCYRKATLLRPEAVNSKLSAVLMFSVTFTIEHGHRLLLGQYRLRPHISSCFHPLLPSSERSFFIGEHLCSITVLLNYIKYVVSKIVTVYTNTHLCVSYVMRIGLNFLRYIIFKTIYILSFSAYLLHEEAGWSYIMRIFIICTEEDELYGGSICHLYKGALTYGISVLKKNLRTVTTTETEAFTEV